jgi:hypothetical protein
MATILQQPMILLIVTPAEFGVVAVCAVDACQLIIAVSVTLSLMQITDFRNLPSLPFFSHDSKRKFCLARMG